MLFLKISSPPVFLKACKSPPISLLLAVSQRLCSSRSMSSHTMLDITLADFPCTI
jgi:hypothetical protein